jgi:RNA polymerase sigma factor (sigma-70 family)
MNVKPVAPLTVTERRTAAANVGLLFVALRRWRHLARQLDHDDALSAAHCGLIRAVRHHDPARGKLSTLVGWAVRNELYIALMSQTRKKRDARRTRHFGLDAEGERMVLEPADYREEAPDAPVVRAELVVRAVAGTLAAGRRAAYVFAQRFVNGRTLDDIAAELHVSRQRAEQLSSRAARYARQTVG